MGTHETERGDYGRASEKSPALGKEKDLKIKIKEGWGRFVKIPWKVTEGRERSDYKTEKNRAEDRVQSRGKTRRIW